MGDSDIDRPLGRAPTGKFLRLLVAAAEEDREQQCGCRQAPDDDRAGGEIRSHRQQEAGETADRTNRVTRENTLPAVRNVTRRDRRDNQAGEDEEDADDDENGPAKRDSLSSKSEEEADRENDALAIPMDLDE